MDGLIYLIFFGSFLVLLHQFGGTKHFTEFTKKEWMIRIVISGVYLGLFIIWKWLQQ